MNIFNKVKLWRGLAAVFAFLMAVCICASVLAFENEGQVNAFLGIIAESTISGGDDGTDTTYYKTKYTDDGKPSDAGLVKLKTAADAFTQRQMEEGAVLVSNRIITGTTKALPLASTERSITMFGRAAADPVYKNKSGSPLIDGSSRKVSLYDAFKNKGFSINDTIFNALGSSGVSRVSSGSANIGEVPVGFYTEYASSYASSYNDVALVVFSRFGGEGIDMQKVDAEGVSQLSLHQKEGDVLKMIKSSGKFGKTIVLINSGNAVDLSWVNDYETYGVDACLWVGGPGLNGFRGVPTLLIGEANPSGHFIDTYATSQLSAPGVVNSGNFNWTNAEYVRSKANGNAGTGAYVVEQESIYVGYKYYETRYNDCILKQFNADSTVGRTESYNEGNDTAKKVLYSGSEGWNYAKEMAFPFGHGLSYTTFTQELVNASGAAATAPVYDAATDTYTFHVKVTNTGTRTGKSVVQLYFQSPYTEYNRQNLVEKAAVQLVGFGKTGELGTSGASASEIIEITVDKYFLASYDTFGKKHYILDGGNYYFGIGENAHDALNNILAKKIANESITNYNPLIDIDYGTGRLATTTGVVTTGSTSKAMVITLGTVGNVDDTTYKNSIYTGVEVTNVFTGMNAVDINEWIADSVTYLTRGGKSNDWATSFPTSAVTLEATDDMIKYLNGDYYEKPANAPAVSSFEVEKDYGLKFIDMRFVEMTGLNDKGEDQAEIWEKFVSQMTIGELASIIDENYGQKEVKSIAKPINNNNDGPDGIKNSYLFGPKTDNNCTCYVNESVTASTWSREILTLLGDFLAEDALYTRVQQMWAPGGNLHRTPFSGRNFEYYSEDAMMSYLCGAIQSKAMQDRGLTAAIKHFAANDQETNRSGLAVFATEQRLRQEAFRGFEGAFAVGGALGTMTAYNRYGCIQTAQSSPAQITVLRKEWGFNGVTITDASKSDLMHSFESLTNGTDTFNADTRSPEVISAIKKGDGFLLQQLREANKHFYYAFVRTSLINGLTGASTVSGFTPWWQPSLVVLNIALGVLMTGCIAMIVLGMYVFKDKTQKKEGV